MCLARAKTDLTIALHQPAQLDDLRPRQLPVRAAHKAWLAHDVLGLTLKLPKGDGFQYLPGQYVDLLIDDGRRRSFSVANRPDGETLHFIRPDTRRAGKACVSTCKYRWSQYTYKK